MTERTEILRAWQDANAVEYCLREALRHLLLAAKYAEGLEPNDEFLAALTAAQEALPALQTEAGLLRRRKLFDYEKIAGKST